MQSEAYNTYHSEDGQKQLIVGGQGLEISDYECAAPLGLAVTVLVPMINVPGKRSRIGSVGQLVSLALYSVESTPEFC